MRPIRQLALALWVAVFLLGGLWLGNRWRDRAAEPANPPPPSAEAAPRAAPDRLPAITLKDLKGTPRSLDEWRGRTLLVNFWATWCAPCRKEMPLLENLQQSVSPDTLQVVGIAIDRLEPVLRFVGETGVSYPILAGEADASAAAEQFGDAFVALPFSVIAGPDGTVLASHTGELDARELGLIAEVADGLAAGRLAPEAARDALQRRLGPSKR
jgi:thiol-disulfide isomerase/thioredoxin